MDFSLSLAYDLLDSSDAFPVDFDKGWKWIGYSRKDSAKRFLVENFEEGIDYRIIVESDSSNTFSPQEKAVQSKREKITLTIDCFKMWSMMAGTEKGKQVRLYFLECEKSAKSKKILTEGDLERLLSNFTNQLLQPQMEKINKYEQTCNEHRGTGNVIKSGVNEEYYPDEVVTTSEFCSQKKLDRPYWNTFSKRYAQFVRVGTKQKPPKRNGKLLIYGELYFYAKEALDSIIYDNY